MSTLDQQINALFPSPNFEVFRSFLVRDTSDVVLDVDGKAETIFDRARSPLDAVQAAPTKRPLYHATGLLGGPSLHFTGGQVISTPTFRVDGWRSLAIVSLCCNESPDYTGYFCCHGDGTEGISLRCHAGNPPVLNELSNRVRVANLISEIRTAPLFPMYDANVLVGTYDKALTTEETHLYHGLDLVDHHRVSGANYDTVGEFTWPLPFRIGAANGTPTRDLRGHVAAAIYVGMAGPPDLVRLGALVGLLSAWRGIV